jgi:hypothetical protein
LFFAQLTAKARLRQRWKALCALDQALAREPQDRRYQFERLIFLMGKILNFLWKIPNSFGQLIQRETGLLAVSQ